MNKKLTWKRFFKSKLFFVAGMVILLFLSVNLTRAQLKDRTIRQEIASLQGEIETLEREREARESLLALLQTPEFLEKEARRVLGYARPGEEVVVIEENGECRMRNEECVEGKDAGLKERSNPRKWWIYFFGEI